MSNYRKAIIRPLLILISSISIGCKGSGVSISILPSNEYHDQVERKSNKVDILFVIDDSGSMKPIQDNLQANFESFINTFFELDFDFRIAVVKTSAYSLRSATQTFNGVTYYESGRTVHEFRCGHGNNCGGFTEYGRACTGVYGDIPTTNGNGVPRAKTDADVGTDHILYSSDFEKTEEGRKQLIEKFIRNADVGTCGAGDERALQSTETVLRAMRDIYKDDHQFPRKESHFAIVHVGDEPDGKWSTLASSNSRGSLDGHNFTDIPLAENGNLEQSKLAVLAYLDALVLHEPTADISVHAIQNISAECNSESYIGHAQLYMAEITKGKTISICNDFGTELSSLGEYIISLASEFYLNSSDVLIESLKVYVNDGITDIEIPRTMNPNDEYGFYLLENPYRINFMPKSVPKDGSKIRVVFMRENLSR